MTHQHLIEGCFDNLEHNDAWPPKRTAVQQQLATSIVKNDCHDYNVITIHLNTPSWQDIPDSRNFRIKTAYMPWCDRPRLRKRSISTLGTTRLRGAGGGGSRMRCRGTSLIRNRAPLGTTVRPCLQPYGSLRGGTLSYERGTPVPKQPPSSKRTHDCREAFIRGNLFFFSLTSNRFTTPMF